MDNIVTEKVCTKCKDTKPVGSFGNHNRTKDGLRKWCRSCEYESSKSRISGYSVEKRKAYKRAYYLKHPETWQRLRLIRYGITIEEYTEMKSAQKNRCAICGKESDKVLVVDHAHNNGKVRGLLCHKCNKGLGFLDDSEEVLESAITYLRIHNE